MASIEQIFENNRRWVAERLSADPEYFRKLSAGQNPRVGLAEAPRHQFIHALVEAVGLVGPAAIRDETRRRFPVGAGIGSALAKHVHEICPSTHCADGEPIAETFGESGQIKPGHYEIGDYVIDITQGLEGITIAILDNMTGAQSSILVPFF